MHRPLLRGAQPAQHLLAHAPRGAARRLSATASAAPARIVLCGAGWWSQGWHLPHLERNPNSQLAAIVDPAKHMHSTLNPEIQQVVELGERYGVPTFDSIDELLASNVQADGVVVCSTHATHFDIGMKALGAGMHVLMEKPMTTDPAESAELAAAAAASDRFFGVNNTANWRKNAVKAAEIVAAGDIGEIEHVNAYMGSPLLWLFDDPANEGWVKPTGNMAGNGFGWGQLSHTLAWVFQVTNLLPKKVFAFMHYSEKTGADLYDSATILCENGATISVQGVAALPGKNPVASKQIDNKVFGSEGFIMYSGDDQDTESGALLLRRHDGREEEHAGFEFENYEQDGLGPESLRNFVDACRGAPSYNGCDAAVGHCVVSVIDAMYRSAKEHKAIDIEL